MATKLVYTGTCTHMYMYLPARMTELLFPSLVVLSFLAAGHTGMQSKNAINTSSCKLPGNCPREGHSLKLYICSL